MPGAASPPGRGPNSSAALRRPDGEAPDRSGICTGPLRMPARPRPL